MLRSAIRLLLPVAALLVAALGVYAVVVWDDPLNRAEERLTEAAVAMQSLTMSSSLLEEAATRNGYDRLWIVEGSGQLVASSRPAESGTRIAEPWAGLLAAATEPALFHAVSWGDRLMLFAAYRSAETGRWSVVLEDGSWVGEERWARLARAVAIGVCMVVLIAAAVFFSLRRNLLAPLQDLAGAASTEKTAPTATIERIASTGTGAIERLATALNALWLERDTLRRDLNEQQALQLATTYLAREMIMVATFEGRIIDVNRSFCRRLSLERSRIVGRPLATLEGILPARALLEMGERSAREQRPFERLLFSFSPRDDVSFGVTAAVQAVPYAGEPAFIMVADARPRRDAPAIEVEPAPPVEVAESARSVGGTADDPATQEPVNVDGPGPLDADGPDPETNDGPDEISGEDDTPHPLTDEDDKPHPLDDEDDKPAKI